MANDLVENENEFSRDDVIREAKSKTKELANKKKGFGYAAAFFLGGTFFCEVTNPFNPLSFLLGPLALICMWSNHQLGEHIKSINHGIMDVQKDKKHSQNQLLLLMGYSFFEIFLS